MYLCSKPLISLNSDDALLTCVFLLAFLNLILPAFYNIPEPNISVVEALDSSHS